MRALRSAALAAALGLAGAGLSACNHSNDTMAAAGSDGSVCEPFPKTVAATPAAAPAAPPMAAPPMAAPGPAAGAPITAQPAAGDPTVALDDCLHRWAYVLARSTDDAQQVSNAVMAACGPSLLRWNQAALATGPAGSPTAPSLVTGQPTTPLNEHFIFAQSRALFYVVQARAGKCAAPPMKDGIPVGVSS